MSDLEHSMTYLDIAVRALEAAREAHQRHSGLDDVRLRKPLTAAQDALDHVTDEVMVERYEAMVEIDNEH